MRPIDAEAVYKDMKNKLVLKPEEFATRVHYIQSAALNCVAGAPTIEAKPVVHAHWEGGTCSHCKLPWNYNMTDDGDDWGYFDPMPDYCCNCGAQMDEFAGDINVGSKKE